MDESSLAAMFEQAVAARPPTPDLITNALQTGRKLRMRHHITAAIATIAAIGIVAAVAPAALGALNHQAPEAPTRNAQSLYVASRSGLVTMIKPRGHAAGRTIQISGVPSGATPMAATTDGRIVYVAGDRGTITPVYTASDRAGTPIRVTSQHLTDLVVAPDGKKAYALEPSRGILPINLVTWRAGRLIPDANAQQLTLTPDGSTLYVADRLAGVISIRTATDTRLAAIPHESRILAIAANSETVYLTCEPGSAPALGCGIGSGVTPVSTATNTALKPTRMHGEIVQLVVEPNGRDAYALIRPPVVMHGTHTYGAGVVVPVNLAAGTEGHKVTIDNKEVATSIALTPDGNRLYIAEMQAFKHGSQMTVYLLRTADNLMFAILILPASSVTFMTMSPNGSLIYLGLRSGAKSSVVRITSATERSAKALVLPGQPVAEAVTP